MRAKSKKHKCSVTWCRRQCDDIQEMKEHEFLEHPDLFNKRKRKRFDNFDDKLKKYYKRMAKNSVSKTISTSGSPNIATKRKLNPKCEPDLLYSIKDVVDIDKIFDK